MYDPSDIDGYSDFLIQDELGSIMSYNLSDNDSIMVNGSERIYLPGMFEIKDYGVLICESNLIEMVVDGINDMLVQGVLFSFLLSMLFLLITAWYLHTTICRLNFQPVIVYLLTYVLLLMVPVMFDVSAACYSAAVLLTHAFLAIPLWISLDCL